MSGSRAGAETRPALAAAWAQLPMALRTPTQFMGRHYVGCGATIGAMPKRDFSCRGCYLGSTLNGLSRSGGGTQYPRFNRSAL